MSQQDRDCESEKGRKLAWLRSFDRAGGILMSVVILYLGYSLTTGLRTVMFSQLPPSGPAGNIELAESDGVGLPEFFVPDSSDLDGVLEIPGWQWKLERQMVKQDQLDQERGLLPTHPSNIATGESLPAELRQLLVILAELGKRTELEDFSLYEVDSEEAKIRIATRGTGEQERLLTGSLALPQPDGNWLLIALSHVGRRSDEVISESTIPLPVGSQPLCWYRPPGGGGLRFAMYRWPGSKGALIDYWQSNAWQFEILPAKSKGLSQGQFQYLCYRDQQVFLVSGPEGSRAGFVMLLRLDTEGAGT
jgi:hypothetical protein